MTMAYGISMICMALALAILGWRVSVHEKHMAVMNYLMFEELRLRASGASDEHILKAWDFSPMSELERGTGPKLMWFRDDQEHVTLAFTDGHEMWWTDDAMQPVEWALINDGAEKIAIRVEFFDEENGEDTAQDKVQDKAQDTDRIVIDGEETKQ